MEKNLIISAVHGRKRVALCENGELVEFHIERDFGQKIVGNIYKGQIVNVLSGMQAAFVNIGLITSTVAGAVLCGLSPLLGLAAAALSIAVSTKILRRKEF